MRLDPIFRPKSVAIIGASKTPGKVGNILMKNVIESGFRGAIYPINPNADEVMGLKCYTSVLEVPGEVELAVVAIPAELVLNVAEECGRKEVKALIVISAGFKETGREGSLLERKLIEVGSKYGMMIQGPNCLGVIDTSTPLNLTFAAAMPRRGKIGFISQSGALGTAVLDWVIKEDIGFSNFVSLGNKADLDESDFIKAMGDDENVDVILLYLESIEEGQRFIDIARTVTKRKPIIVLKGGTSTAGARAAGSHTGALVGSYVAYQQAFEKAGVIAAESVEELFNYGIGFTEQPLPKGEGVAIITNAGGPGILATDLSEKLGVKLAQISRLTRKQLIDKLPAAASTGNPIDILGDARADRYGFALERVLDDKGVNTVVVILTPQAMTESKATAESIVKIGKYHMEKPIFAVFMGGGTVEDASHYLKGNGVPCFDFPEKAIRTLAALFKYSSNLSESDHNPYVFKNVDREKVEEVFKVVKREGRIVLLPHEAIEVVEAYGISGPRSKIARSADEAVSYAEEFGYPVVMKIVSPDILHKTDIGGVALNLNSADEVWSSFEGIMTRVARFMPQARIYGIMIYRMMPAGREMIIGMSRDVQFGPLVMFGLGGIYVNFLRDVSFRLAPLSKMEVMQMIEETKAFELLKGIRGQPPSDISALVETILRIGQLVWDFPQIVEMDINPVIVYEEEGGCIALDVKITLASD